MSAETYTALQTLITGLKNSATQGSITPERLGNLIATFVESVNVKTYSGELTIASGVISIPGPGFFIIDTEADAATDDLYKIQAATGYTLADGDTVFLRTSSSSRDVVLRRTGGAGDPGGGNIVTIDGAEIQYRDDMRALMYSGGFWLPFNPFWSNTSAKLYANLECNNLGVVNAQNVHAFRTGKNFYLGPTSDPTRGTAAASGGTVSESISVAEGTQVEFTWHATGLQASTGHVFRTMGRASVHRVSGGTAFILENDDAASSSTEIAHSLTDATDGTDTGALADEIVVTASIVSNTFRVTITNNSASNALDLTSSGLAVGSMVSDL